MNAKAFRAHRELRIMFAAWKTLCPPSEDTEVTDYFSVFSVLRGLILFSTEDTEVTDYFSVFSVLRGLILFSTDDTKVTDYFQCFLCAPWFNFIFHGRHGSHGLFSVFSVCSVV